MGDDNSSGSAAPERRRASDAHSDDIQSLRKEKLQLLEVRRDLRQRLAQAELESHPYGMVTSRLARQLNGEYEELQQLVGRQRRQLEAMRTWESAAVRAELQEEIKVVYVELVRLRQLDEMQQGALLRLDLRYRELVDGDSPEIIARQEQKIQRYFAKLAKYQDANLRLASAARIAKANRAFDTPEGQREVRQRAETLLAAIDRVCAEIEDIERQMHEANTEHQTAMEAVKAKKVHQPPAAAAPTDE
jgi:hypothetical protein